MPLNRILSKTISFLDKQLDSSSSVCRPSVLPMLPQGHAPSALADSILKFHQDVDKQMQGIPFFLGGLAGVMKAVRPEDQLHLPRLAIRWPPQCYPHSHSSPLPSSSSSKSGSGGPSVSLASKHWTLFSHCPHPAHLLHSECPKPFTAFLLAVLPSAVASMSYASLGSPSPTECRLHDAAPPF